MQLDTLWQFMQVDMEADGFESRMRQSANRQKLIKQRDFLKDQQANMKKLENDVAVMQDRLEAVQDEADRLQKVLENQSVLRQPIVRNGRQATVGYRPEIWKEWE